MGVKKDPAHPGTYIVSYGKRHPVHRIPVSLRRRGIKSLAEANRIFADLVIEVEDKLRKAVVPKWSMLLQDFLLAAQGRYAKKTIYDFEACLRAHTLETWGARFVDTITTEEIRELLKDRVGHRSPSHQKYFLKWIRIVFSFAIGKGFMDRNPTPEIKFNMGDKIKQCLTEDQVRVLLAKAQTYEWEWYPHVATALYTGIRTGELYALLWDQVDLEKRLILVNRSWNNKDGFKSTKSGDDRLVEIAPPLLHMLKELKLQNGSHSKFVLPRLQKWDKGEQARELQMFLLGIGLPSIRFHDLRATWATILLSKGVEPIKVMKQGGWKNIDTMMIYVRKAGIDIKGTSDCLDLHDPTAQPGKVIQMGARSEL